MAVGIVVVAVEVNVGVVVVGVVASGVFVVGNREIERDVGVVGVARLGWAGSLCGGGSDCRSRCWYVGLCRRGVGVSLLCCIGGERVCKM